ncbi:MAG: Holliday junction branch migration protein RuvA [Clostridia bacterium]|nr:Holliday junction branch migration protein RuvA [Clostridia bacterium]
MYAFIEGKVCEKSGGTLILQAGGVGYLLTCSLTTIQAAPPVGQTMRCMTYLSVREDAMELFGFATQEEKDLFLRLIAISGVGPKLALSILGSMPVRDLQVAILMDDVTAISRAPGVGKKTAQRITLELRDKITQAEVSSVSAVADIPVKPQAADSLGEALEALMALGYTATEARTALSHVKDRNAPVDELITQALRSMASL